MQLLMRKRELLRERLIELPIRETSLSHFAEKKRQEYKTIRKAYSGLFDDEKIVQIAESTPGIISRTTAISETLINEWSSGPDTKSAPWIPVLRNFSAKDVEIIRGIPGILHSRGIAATWLAISRSLPQCHKGHKVNIRKILQHDYFNLYLNEFNLNVVFNIPHMGASFYLTHGTRAYDYEWIKTAFDAIGLKTIFDFDAETIVKLKRNPEFIAFMDAFYGICQISTSKTDLVVFISNALKSARIQSIGTQLKLSHSALTGEYGLEDDALTKLSDDLERLVPILAETACNNARLNNLVRSASNSSSIIWKNAAMETGKEKIVFFVALEEELKVLVKILILERKFGSNIAYGVIGNGFNICVICANAMGRVPAAVATCNFLSKRSSDSMPRLLVVIGLAGGFKEQNVEEGMLLFPTTVVDLASRKIKEVKSETQTEFRREDFRLNNCLYDFVSSTNFNKEKWQSEVVGDADWPPSRRPAFVPGLIASLDEVVSDSSWASELQGASPKLLGVEMEAGGVCAAANTYNVPVAMIRAVSDMADPSKTDTAWRTRGMKTIASLLKHIDWEVIVNHLER